LVRGIFKKYFVFLLGLVLLPLGLLLRHLPGDAPDITRQVDIIQEQVAVNMQWLEESMTPVLEYMTTNEILRFSDINNLGNYPFFVVEGRRMVYWSGNKVAPLFDVPSDSLTWQMVQQTNGNYLVRQWEVGGQHGKIRKLYAVLPLYTRYKIDNKYLHSRPADYLPAELTHVGAPGEWETDICFATTGCLFSVALSPVSGTGLWRANLAVIILLTAFFLVGGASIHLGLKGLKKPEQQVLLVGLVLLVLRAVMLFFEFPTSYLATPIFDPKNFASSYLNPSLGDLLLNVVVVLLFASFLFFQHHKFRFYTKISSSSKALRFAIAMALYGVGMVAFHLVLIIFQTIYHNSQLTFDITGSIRFDILRETGYLIFILSTLAVFLFLHVILRLSTKLLDGSILRQGMSFFLALTLFMLVNFLIGQYFLSVVLVASGYFFLIKILRFDQSLGKLTFFSFLYFFSLALVVSLLGALSVHRFEVERHLREKERFARQMLIENDNLAEFLLAEAAEKIQNDAFIKNRLSSPFVSKDIVAEKIRQVFLSKYFDKYDVQIYLYNANGKPFDLNPGLMEFGLVKERFFLEEYATGYPGLYLINRPGEDITRRYLQFAQIEKYGYGIGYILIDLKLKRIIPESVYPELLIDDRFISPNTHRLFSYAVYTDGELDYNYGEFNYVRDFSREVLENATLSKKGIVHRNAHHLALLDDEGQYIVVSTPLYSWMRVVSNFSFFFLLWMFFIGITLLALAIYYYVQKKRLNYSARIQLYLNLAFFFPLLVLSIANISLINRSFKAELAEEYFQRARNIGDNLSGDVDEYLRNVFEGREELTSKLGQAAKFANVDANLFNVGGRLVATSQPQIYEHGLLSNMLNPKVVAQLIEQRQSLSTQREQVGALTYNATYVPIKSFDSGKMIGILSIPFFDSDSLVESRQISVLTTIMSIFTFIFLVFLIISYFASKWLTFPLKFITQKLKKTTLSGFNEPLVWTSDDEIGLMVGEYNRMLVNLEESKLALARSEKETAWREMAQQVAHEIKNPLTPMKLTLQHLQRLVRKLEGPAKEVERPLESLLHQVDTLSDIASSFSDFAKMPIPEHKRFELTALIRKTLSLHSNHEGVQLVAHISEAPLFVMGDEQLMGRILSNILLNASQSGADSVRVSTKQRQGKRVTISVEDNGQGIEEEIRSKVFMPHFTTKETGSGIGLAIAKHGVEHAGGKVWFETESGKGTTFFVELPLVQE
jgi:two-component system, NtrC family, nitrogen regulation sensor histidine kinase NtrY